jgi:hypothetical protein
MIPCRNVAGAPAEGLLAETRRQVVVLTRQVIFRELRVPPCEMSFPTHG